MFGKCWPLNGVQQLEINMLEETRRAKETGTGSPKYILFWIYPYSNNLFKAGNAILALHLDRDASGEYQAGYSQVNGGCFGDHMAGKTLSDLAKVLHLPYLEDQLCPLSDMTETRESANFAYKITFVGRGYGDGRSDPILGEIVICNLGSGMRAFARRYLYKGSDQGFPSGARLLRELKEALESKEFFQGWQNCEPKHSRTIEYELRFGDDRGPVQIAYVRERDQTLTGKIVCSDARVHKARLKEAWRAMNQLHTLLVNSASNSFAAIVGAVEEAVALSKNSANSLKAVNAGVSIVARMLLREENAPSGASRFVEEALLALIDPNFSLLLAKGTVSEFERVLTRLNGEVTYGPSVLPAEESLNRSGWEPVWLLESFVRLTKFEGGVRFLRVWRKGDTWKALYSFRITPMKTDVMRQVGDVRPDEDTFRRDPADTAVILADGKRFISQVREALETKYALTFNAA